MISKIFFKIKTIFHKIRIKNLNLSKKGFNVTISEGFNFNKPENIEIESHIYIGPKATMYAHGKIIIRRGSIIGPNITIYTANHNFKSGAESIPYDKELDIRSVEISENVWIGGNVLLLPGAKLGEGVIVGAGCVIAKEIPPYSIVIGNPCIIIGRRNIKEYNQLKDIDAIYLKKKAEANAKKL